MANYFNRQGCGKARPVAVSNILGRMEHGPCTGFLASVLPALYHIFLAQASLPAHYDGAYCFLH